jgi:hypothetical protein
LAAEETCQAGDRRRRPAAESKRPPTGRHFRCSLGPEHRFGNGYNSKWLREAGVRLGSKQMSSRPAGRQTGPSKRYFHRTGATCATAQPNCPKAQRCRGRPSTIAVFMGSLETGFPLRPPVPSGANRHGPRINRSRGSPGFGTNKPPNRLIQTNLGIRGRRPIEGRGSGPCRWAGCTT